MYAGKRYVIQEGLRLQDYPGRVALPYQINLRNRQATLAPEARQKLKDLDLPDEQQARADERDRLTEFVRGRIGAARLEIIGSSYNHNANGDKSSKYVGAKNNPQTDAFIVKTIADQGDQLQCSRVVGQGEYKCTIDIGDGETIAFSYMNGWITVYHVGSGAKQ